MDKVNHPSHYNQHPSGVECINIVEYYNFNVGNAIKYLWRAGLKSDNPIEDLQKALWYCQREIERLSKEKETEKVEETQERYFKFFDGANWYATRNINNTSNAVMVTEITKEEYEDCNNPLAKLLQGKEKS